jgi:hypothetical protein
VIAKGTGQVALAISLKDAGTDVLDPSGKYIQSLGVDGVAVQPDSCLQAGGNQASGTITITKPLYNAGEHKVNLTVKLKSGGTASTKDGKPQTVQFQ